MTPSRSRIFQVGGSLAADAASYVERSADEEIFTALMNGELCYVFNSRQMGKSSLQVRTRHRLEARGARCAFCDLTRIGTAMIQPQQWYAGFAAELCRGFRIRPDGGFAGWWRERDHLPPLSRLAELLEDVILPEISENRAYVFLDEIENAFSLTFSMDDFFAWIRSCANKKAEDPRYRRLTFALFGVVTPGDLISDTSQTSFNIGHAVDLAGLRFEESAPLAAGLTGLELPEEELLGAILDWTGGQPFLTQKLCRLVANNDTERDGRTSKDVVGSVVAAELLARWEYQDEPEHLRTIRDRILAQPELSSRMLSIIREVQSGSGVSFDGSREHIELQLSGLMVRNGARLEVRNRLYHRVFDQEWVDRHLAELRPYAESIKAWVASKEKDESRLLVGDALREAREWSRGRSLSDGDHRYLRASEEVSRVFEQREADAVRAHEAEARLSEREGFVRRQRVLISALSFALIIALGLGAFGFTQYRKAVANQRRAAERAAEANQVSDFLVEVFGAADPMEARGDPPTAPALLEKGAQRIQDELGSQPLLQARLMATIGRTYDMLGLYDEGAVQLEGALEIREGELGPEHEDVASSLTNLATLYLNQGREAEPLLRRAAAIQEQALDVDETELAKTFNNLGVLLARRGSFEDAETLFRRVVAIRENASEPDEAEVANGLQNLAGVLAETGRLEEAEPIHQRALEITEKLFGPDHPNLAIDLELSAFYRERRGDHEEALELLQRAYNLNVNAFGPRHPRIAQVLARIGMNYLDRGLWEEAEPYLRLALEQREELLDPNNVSMVHSLRAMARLSAIKGDHVEAVELYDRALSVAEVRMDPSHTLTQSIVSEYAKILRELGREEAAAELETR